MRPPILFVYKEKIEEECAPERRQVQSALYGVALNSVHSDTSGTTNT
jgi:hypothetical protein